MTCATVRRTRATLDIEATRGDDWSDTLTFTIATVAENVSGCTFAGQMRPTADSATISASFVWDMTQAAAGLVFFTVSFAGLAPGFYAYDLEMTDENGVTTTFVGGTITLAQDTTR